MSFDFLIIGAGAGGGIAAMILAEAGHQVLLLERGRLLTYATAGHRDHLRNHRLSLYGHNTGPSLTGNPRVFVSPSGHEHIVQPHQGGYHHNASCVGSGTFVYGAQAWRFAPDDFQMATKYGVPQGSSLTDWPFPYETLAPFYDQAEWELGVAGESTTQHPSSRTRGYPMPPPRDQPSTHALRKGAQALGISTTRVPLLINTIPYNNRPACIECGSCVGFPCPSDGKNGTQNTAIPRALATGNCTLLTQATVSKITTNDQGNVTGVELARPSPDDPNKRTTFTARNVVLAAGAIESARLLLLSSSKLHPTGLGNRHDHVGRHLQGHYYPTVTGLFDHDIYNDYGPGVTLATTDFTHNNPGVIGGAMIADDFIVLPAIFFKNLLPPRLRRWGLEAKHFMRDNYRRTLQVKGPVHEIPNPDSRVTLAHDVLDADGLPVARLSGTTHPETVRTAEFIHHQLTRWLTASGAHTTWGHPPGLHLSAHQHQAGTCRMGHDPHLSVTDPWGRVHDHDNLYITDGSLHPTNGAFNPVLTILANAYRISSHLARN